MDWNKMFIYDSGLLRWRYARKGREARSIAGSKTKQEYIRVKVFGKCYLAHRIIWEMHNGKIPEGIEIDHINHIRNDNRIENLRIVSRVENCRNMSKSKVNSSGVTGVCWSAKENKWHASIYNKGKNIHLGYFLNMDDTVRVREQAEVKLGYHENHGK